MQSKLALVTGASSGLGKALCVELAKRNIPLLLVARSEDKLHALAKQLPVPTFIHPADLSLSTDRKILLERIREEKPDLLFNNAGFGLYGPVLTHPLSAMQEIVEVNLDAVMELSIETARTLIAADKRGTIVNISSAAAFFSYPTFCVYAATKAFINNFSQGLDAELRKQGVRVLTVCPGQIATGFRTRASKGKPQKEDLLTFSAQKAARLILTQVDRGKSLSIIDWKYQLLVPIAKLFPQKIVQTLLARTLRERY